MIENPDGTVTLTGVEYKELIDDQMFLQALRGAGVDNWDGYDYACEAYRESAGEDN